jgi:hypothetical protein
MVAIFTAAEIAAAEAAAVAAAEVAAAEAATAAAATTAAETVAAQQAAQAAAATTAASTAASAGSGIMSAAPTAAAAVGPESAMAAQAAQGGMGAGAGLEQATAAMQQGALQLPPAGLEQLNTAGQSLNLEALQGPVSQVPPDPTRFIPPSEANLSAAQHAAGTGAFPPAAPPPSPPGITSVPSPDPYALSKPPAPSPYMSRLGDTYNFTSPSVSLGDQYAANAGRGTFSGMAEATAAPAPAQPTSAFMRGVDSAMQFVDKYPKTSMAGAYLGASALGLLKPNYSNYNKAPYDGPLNKITMSPNFKASDADPSQYRYTPRYAEGGIMQMAQGGVTGSGNLTLNVPLDLGGGQNGGQSTPDFAFGNGNSGANTGFFGQNSNQVNQSSMAQQNGSSGLLQQLKQVGPALQTYDSQPDSNPINVGGSAGVQNFARGGSTGNLSGTLDYYTKMMEGETPKVPAQHPEGVGIYHDTDPDTRSLDPYSAARTRLAKTNKRAYVTAPKGPEPYVGGQLNFNPPGVKPDTTQYQEAAKGGIMGLSDLGGYAAGGNPRLLKGPGDGMSDNIPATINGRQPARLADGEFVIPADVVSHLGNGSTEAGAKVLHQMMTKVRQERTGNPKQGKQINPRKYIPR